MHYSSRVDKILIETKHLQTLVYLVCLALAVGYVLQYLLYKCSLMRGCKILTIKAVYKLTQYL